MAPHNNLISCYNYLPQNPSGGANQGPDFCPQLQQQAGEELLPVGIQREILVNVSNLPNASKVDRNLR